MKGSGGYDPRRYAGAAWKNSSKGTCPHCGGPRSHGMMGNPDKRKVPPCLASGHSAAHPLRARDSDAARGIAPLAEKGVNRNTRS